MPLCVCLYIKFSTPLSCLQRGMPSLSPHSPHGQHVNTDSIHGFFSFHLFFVPVHLFCVYNWGFFFRLPTVFLHRILNPYLSHYTSIAKPQSILHAVVLVGFGPVPSYPIPSHTLPLPHREYICSQHADTYHASDSRSVMWIDASRIRCHVVQIPFLGCTRVLC